MQYDPRQATANRLAGLEKGSAIVWIVIGSIQALSGIGLCAEEIGAVGGPLIILGIWNIIAGICGFGKVPRIRQRDPAIPDEYEGITGLIITGIVNLLFGALIGIAGVIFDFYVRSEILGNRQIFAEGDQPIAASASQPAAAAPSNESKYEMLKQLHELKTSGILSDEEFAKEKAKIMG